MALIVAVHGIAQQLKGENVLKAEWLPALRDGLLRVGMGFPNDQELKCIFYGDIFRKKGTKALGDPPYDAGDVTEEWEKEMLEVWWCEAARVEAQVPGPEARTKLRTPSLVQRALNALSNSRFFVGVAEKVMIGNLKQVYRYLHEPEVREKVQRPIVEAVSPDTKVMIGHSMGSIVAYEALCAHPEWSIQTFVTLGSPLGIRNLIFDKLQPAPQENIGIWPGNIRRWFNIADGGDIVALVKELRTRFGEQVQDRLIYNGATAHNISPYLTAQETGRAIATGLGPS